MPEFLIERGRFEEAMAAAQTLEKSEWPMARMAAHSLAGEACLGLSKIEEAEEQLRLAEEEAQHIPGRVATTLPYPATLRAAMLLRENRTQEGEGIFVKVEQSAMAMPGPDGWIAAIFVLESIAREARNAGDWQLAQFTAEQMIQHDPYYAGGHYAIGLVAEHAGETDGARQMFAEAQRLWSRGDSDLPELVETRQKLNSPGN